MVLVEELSSRNVKPKADSDSITKNSGLLQTGVFSCAYTTLMQTDTRYQKQTTKDMDLEIAFHRGRSILFYYAAFALLFFLVCYFGAYSIAQLHEYRIAIPESAWSFAYISIYFAKGLTPFAVRSRQECLAWSRSLCYSVSLATIVFILFPTEQPSVVHLPYVSLDAGNRLLDCRPAFTLSGRCCRRSDRRLDCDCGQPEEATFSGTKGSRALKNPNRSQGSKCG